MATRESFADRIRRLRLARGLCEWELAERMGITVHQFQSVAGAGAVPTCATLMALTEALDISVADLTDLMLEAAPTLEQLRAFLHELDRKRMDEAAQRSSADRRLARMHQAVGIEIEPESDSVAALMRSAARDETLRAWSSLYVRLVLHRCKGNRAQACRVLGIHYHTLRQHLRYPVDGEKRRDAVNSAGAAETLTGG